MDKKAVAPHSPFCRHASCVRAILKGFVAGLAYGAKVRFPHALGWCCTTWPCATHDRVWN